MNDSGSASLPKQFQWWGLVPVVVGLHGLSVIQGMATAVLFGPVSLMLISVGTIIALLPGDRRLTAYLAVASLLGLIIATLSVIFLGWSSVLLGLGSAASFLISGRISLASESPERVPKPIESTEMKIKVGFDEAVMGFFVMVAKVPGDEEARTVCDEALELRNALSEGGWSENPVGLHAEPEAPADVQSRPGSHRGINFEQLSCDSDYAPEPSFPGAARWPGHFANRRAQARMMRHPGPTRPWVMCIHGYRMGEAWMDFGLFRPNYLHHSMGFNVLMPTLPLHGPRRSGSKSGDHYLDGNLLDVVFAQSQALWDLRRWIAWLRANEDRPEIGVYGVSLGGYNTGLLAGYEGALSFVVAGIPVVDLAEALWRVVPPAHQRYFASRGLDQQAYQDLLRPVSPLTLPVQVGADRRFVFAASADRIVPAAQPVALADHWQIDTHWYQGSHMSIANEDTPKNVLESAFKAAGWNS